MSGHVFINYRRDDSAGFAGRIYDRLASSFSPEQIFIDVDDIPPGRDFVAALDNQVGKCDVFIVIIGPDWLASADQIGQTRLFKEDDFVRIEIASALKRNIQVIPVLIKGAQMPTAAQLPPDLQALLQRNALEITYTRFHTDVARLIKSIKRGFPFRARYAKAGRVTGRLATLVIAAAAGYYAIALSLIRVPYLETLIRPAAAEWSQMGYGDQINPAVLKSFLSRYPVAPEKEEAENRLIDIIERHWGRLGPSPDRSQVSDFITLYQGYPSDIIDKARKRLKTRQDDGDGKTPGARFRDCAGCPEMIVLPAGRFWAGSPETELFRKSHEGPVERITIAKPFAVGQFEITVGQYKNFVEESGRDMGRDCLGVIDPEIDEQNWVDIPGNRFDKPGFSQSDSHPVVCVSWADAKAYIGWLNKKVGGDYRLLSEVEWEYAARAGTRTTFSFGDNQANLCSYGNGADRNTGLWERDFNNWCFDGKAWETAAVGSYRANGFGLRDMHGNAQEWVEDCYHKSYAGRPGAVKESGTAWTTKGCAERVIRSGCWYYPPAGLRSAKRESWDGNNRSYCVGFRIAKTIK